METLSTATFSSLEELLSPFAYGPEEEVPLTLGERVSGRQGHLSRDGEWGYSFNGPILRCFPVSTAQSVGRRTSLNIPSTPYHFPDAIIKCAKEVSLSDDPWATRHLILGTDSGAAGGSIVIFDPARSIPIRSIRIPSPVESLEVISDGSEATSANLLHAALRPMVGIVAAGLGQGDVILVDLALDHLQISLQAPFTKSLEYEAEFELLEVNGDEEDIEGKRFQSLQHHRLFSLRLNLCQVLCSETDGDDDGMFDYVAPGGDLLRRLPLDQVHITALHYAPQIASVLLGFNFGGFQIWRLENLQLEYSSAWRGWSLPVHSFEFQIPSDDPRNFCYVWLLSGNETAPGTGSTLQLYALDYARRSRAIYNNQPTYYDLRNCVRRLELYLGDCYKAEAGGGVEDPPDGRPIGLRVLEERLLVVVWETGTSAYLGLFDMDQWYSAQTTSIVPIQSPETLCPFWAVIPFLPPTHSRLLHLHLHSDSLERWSNPHAFNALHDYPASTSFRVTCLSENSLFTFTHFGMEEKALRLIQKEGGDLLAQPSLLRQLCSSVGLQPNSSHSFPKDFPQEKADKYDILRLILEASRPALIIQMANAWLDGSFANLGLSIHLIMEWLHHLAHQIRLLAEPHWTLLFTPTNSAHLPPETASFLRYSHFVWSQQKGILWTILRGLPDYSQIDCSDDLERSLERLVQYSSALLLLHRSGLLPPSANTHPHSPLSLQGYYKGRKAQLEASLSDATFIHPEERSAHALLVDYLFDELEEGTLREEMGLEAGEPFYPPSNPGQILNFLIAKWAMDPPGSTLVARIIFYYFLDLMDISKDRGELCGAFETVIELSQEEQDEVATLWSIDHGHLEAGVAGLSRARLEERGSGLPWGPALVSLAAQGCQAQVLQLLQTMSYPPQIARFAVMLALEVEPDSSQTISGRILEFANDQSTFLKVLQFSDEVGILEPLITSQMYKHRRGCVERGVEHYLRLLPPSLLNKLRLFSFLVSTRRIPESIHTYKDLLNTYPDRRAMPPSQRSKMEETERGLKLLLITSDASWKHPPLSAPPSHNESRPHPPLSSTRSSSNENELGKSPQNTPLFRQKGPGGRRKSHENRTFCSEEEGQLPHLLQTPPKLPGRDNSPGTLSPFPQAGRSSIKRKASATPLRDQVLRARFLDMAPPSDGETSVVTRDTICPSSSFGSGSTEPFSPHTSPRLSEGDELSSEGGEETPGFLERNISMVTSDEEPDTGSGHPTGVTPSVGDGVTTITEVGGTESSVVEVSATTQEGATESMEEGFATIQEGATGRIEGNFSTIEEEINGSIEEGDSGTIEKGATTRIEEGNFETMEEEATGGIEEGNFETMEEEATGGIEEGDSASIEEGATGRIEEADSATIEEGATGGIEEGNFETMEEEATGRIEEGNFETMEEEATGRIEEGNFETMEKEATGRVEGNFETMEEGATGGIAEGDSASIGEGATGRIEEGDSATIEEGATGGIEEGDSVTIEEGATGGIEEGDSVTIEEGATGSIEEGDSGTIEKGATTRIEEGDSATIEEGATGGIEEGATGRIEEGDSATIGEGATGSIEEGDSGTIEKGATTRIEEGNFETMEEEATGGIEEGDIASIEEGATGGIEEGDSVTIEEGAMGSIEGNSGPIEVGSTGIDGDSTTMEVEATTIMEVGGTESIEVEDSETIVDGATTIMEVGDTESSEVDHSAAIEEGATGSNEEGDFATIEEGATGSNKRDSGTSEVVSTASVEGGATASIAEGAAGSIEENPATIEVGSTGGIEEGDFATMEDGATVSIEEDSGPIEMGSTVSDEGGATASIAESTSVEESNLSFGVVTRSRARHMSDASFLAQCETTFLGSPDLHDKSALSHCGRAQSEPPGPEKVGRTRRNSSAGGGSVGKSTRRSISVADTLQSAAPPRTTKKGRRKEESPQTTPPPTLNQSQDSGVLSTSFEENSRRASLRRSTLVGGLNQLNHTVPGPFGGNEEDSTPKEPRRRRSRSVTSELDESRESSLNETLEEEPNSDSTSPRSRHRVFDYQPALSTVLEVSEVSEPSPVTTPMTRSRRRSLQVSLELSTPSTPSSSGRKRRRPSASSSIGTIEEEEERPESKRRLSSPPSNDSESALTNSPQPKKKGKSRLPKRKE